MLKQILILHSNGKIHGNLNPAYILPYRDGMILLDAFLFKDEVEIEKLSQKKMKITKNHRYSSPDIIQNRGNVKREDDLFSIGIIALEMCFGRIPLDINQYFSLTRERIHELFIDRNYSKDLIDIISNLLVEGKYEIKINQIKSGRTYKYKKISLDFCIEKVRKVKLNNSCFIKVDCGLSQINYDLEIIENENGLTKLSDYLKFFKNITEVDFESIS